jgi:hypothetical protein
MPANVSTALLCIYGAKIIAMTGLVLWWATAALARGAEPDPPGFAHAWGIRQMVLSYRGFRYDAMLDNGKIIHVRSWHPYCSHRHEEITIGGCRIVRLYDQAGEADLVEAPK